MASSVSELAFNIAYERTTSLLKSAVKGKDYPAIPQSKMLRSAHKAFTELANALREHGEQHVPTGLRLTVFFESKSAMVTPLYKAMPTEDELELVPYAFNNES